RSIRAVAIIVGVVKSRVVQKVRPLRESTAPRRPKHICKTKADSGFCEARRFRVASARADRHGGRDAIDFVAELFTARTKGVYSPQRRHYGRTQTYCGGIHQSVAGDLCCGVDVNRA